MLEQTEINYTLLKRMREKFRLSPKVLSFKNAFFKLENGRKVIVMGDEMLEEMHGKYQSGIADEANGAKIITGMGGMNYGKIYHNI